MSHVKLLLNIINWMAPEKLKDQTNVKFLGNCVIGNDKIINNNNDNDDNNLYL